MNIDRQCDRNNNINNVAISRNQAIYIGEFVPIQFEATNETDFLPFKGTNLSGMHRI